MIGYSRGLTIFWENINLQVISANLTVIGLKNLVRDSLYEARDDQLKGHYWPTFSRLPR